MVFGFDRMKNEAIRKELQVFNLDEKLKEYKPIGHGRVGRPRKRWLGGSLKAEQAAPCLCRVVKIMTVSYTHLDVYKRQVVRHILIFTPSVVSLINHYVPFILAVIFMVLQ